MSYAFIGSLLFQAAYFLILARILGASGLGLFAGALALVSIAAPFAGWGSGNLLVQHTSRSPEMFRERLGVALRAITLTGGGFVLVFVGLSLTLFRGSFGETLIPLAFAELLFARVVDLSAQGFQAHDRLRAAAIVTLSASVARLAALALMAVLIGSGSLGPEHWAIGYAVASLVVAAVSLGGLIRAFGGPVLRRATSMDLRQGFFFSLGSASKTVYSDIDKAMLVRMTTDAVAGIYTAAYRLTTFAYAPIQALLYATNTRFFREGERGASAAWAVARRNIGPIWVFALVAGLMLFLAAPLVPVVLGDSYADSVTALRWLSVMPLITGTHSLFGDALMGMGQQARRSGLQLGAAAVNVVLNLWLIPLHGYSGAIVATIASEGALAVALALLLRHLRRSEEGTHRLTGGKSRMLGEPG